MLLHCEKGKKLTISEKKVIDFINANQEQMSKSSIVDIATYTNVSISTVSRAIRKCGVGKTRDVRYKIMEGNYLNNNVISNTYDDCMDTLHKIKEESLLKVAECIRTANKIHILARGIDTLVAQEFEYRLRYKGYPAVCYRQEIYRAMDRIVEEGDLVIIFSLQASSESLLIASSLAKLKGATVVTCCCSESSTLENLSDIMVQGTYNRISLNSGQKKKFETFSRLGLQIIAQAIVECLN